MNRSKDKVISVMKSVIHPLDAFNAFLFITRQCAAAWASFYLLNNYSRFTQQPFLATSLFTLGLIAVILYSLLTILFWMLREKPASGSTPISVRARVYPQIVLDIAFFSFLCLLTGDIDSNFALFLLLPQLNAVAFLHVRLHLRTLIAIILAYAVAISINAFVLQPQMFTIPQPVPSGQAHILWQVLPTILLFIIIGIPLSFILQRDRNVNQRRVALYELTTDLARATSQEGIYNLLLSRLESIGFERGRIWLTVDEPGILMRGFQSTPNHKSSSQFVRGIPLRTGDVTGMRCMELGRAICFRYEKQWYHRFSKGDWLEVERAKDPMAEVLGKPAAEWIEMPITGGSSSIGKLSIDNAISRRPIIPQDVEQFTFLSSILSIALERVRLLSHYELRNEALDAERQQQEYVFDHLPIAIFRKSSLGVYEFVNRSFCDTLGLQPNLILKKHDRELFSKSIADQAVSGDQQVLGTSELYHGTEDFPFQGRIVKINVIKAPFYRRGVDGKSDLQGVVGYFTFANQAAIDELNEADRVFRMFRWFSHDGPEFVKVQLSLLPQLKAAILQQAINRPALLSLIHDIEALSEIELCGFHAFGYWGSKKRYRWDAGVNPVDITPIIERIVDVCRVNHDGVKIGVVVEPHVETVLIDKFKFMFMVLQLVSNAIKAVESSALTAPHVQIRVEQDSLGTTITVSDNGCGCAPDDRIKIGVDSFSRWGGTGLGLKIVSAFVNLALGRLDQQFPESGGAVFSVTIPKLSVNTKNLV